VAIFNSVDPTLPAQNQLGGFAAKAQSAVPFLNHS
jgi:hypothetical protein